jgi:RNA polymerase sigma factor (sigma-70 family)
MSAVSLIPSSLSREPDARIVALCREGGDAAWEELVNRFDRYVYAIAKRAFRLPPADVEDVFQEAFARTYEHLETIRDDAAIRPWIGQLTRRLCVDKWRAMARETPSEVVEGGEADAALARIEQALDVRRALATLPAHCQEILDRFFARDDSYHAIEAALEIPPGTIASRISRCLAKLRQALEGRGRFSEASSD